MYTNKHILYVCQRFFQNDLYTHPFKILPVLHDVGNGHCSDYIIRAQSN